MDGFIVVKGGRVPFYYFPSREAAAGVQGEWVPWDQAPDAWRQQTVAAGQRGKDNSSTQTGPVPTGRDPFNPAPGSSNSPLSFAGPSGSTTGSPKTTSGTGFLPETKSRDDLLGKVGSFLGKNWKDVLGAGATAFGAYNDYRRQGKADDAADAGLQFAREDWASRAPLRDRFMGMIDGPRPGAPDLADAFADPSNPFYRAAPALPGPLSPNTAGQLPARRRWDAKLKRFV